MFRFFVNNLQCKNIIFAACHDNGYLPNLDQFKRDEEIGSRITLLESTPAEWQYRNLGFPILGFPNIFRSEPLPTKPTAFAQPVVPLYQATQGFTPSSYYSEETATATPGDSDSVSPTLANGSRNVSVDSTASNLSQSGNGPSAAPVSQTSGSKTAQPSYANVGSNTESATKKDINIAPSKPASAQRKAIYLNRKDNRIDRPLPKTDYGGELLLKKRVYQCGKVCNNFHLLDNCKNGVNCKYQHGERLGQKEQLALRHKARSSFCESSSLGGSFPCARRNTI